MILQSRKKNNCKNRKKSGRKNRGVVLKIKCISNFISQKFFTMFMTEYIRVLKFYIYLSISDKDFGQSIFCDKLWELCTSPLKWNDSRSSWLSSVFFEKFNLSSKSWLRCIAFVDVFIVSAVLKVYKNCQLTSTKLHSNHRIKWKWLIGKFKD